MKPIPKFQYHSPESLDEALSLLAELDNALPLIGGTDIIWPLQEQITARRITEPPGRWEKVAIIKAGSTHLLQIINPVESFLFESFPECKHLW